MLKNMHNPDWGALTPSTPIISSTWACCGLHHKSSSSHSALAQNISPCRHHETPAAWITFFLFTSCKDKFSHSHFGCRNISAWGLVFPAGYWEKTYIGKFFKVSCFTLLSWILQEMMKTDSHFISSVSLPPWTLSAFVKSLNHVVIC